MSWRKHGQLASVSPSQITKLIARNRQRIIDQTAMTYVAFYNGQCLNPDTYSLRFPEKPDCRINVLPAYVGGDVDLAGMKWVASFPRNVTQNLQRANAIIVLNSYETGYPLAILDGTGISAARTAASAVLGARLLRPQKTSDCFRLYGAGIINREVVNFLLDDEWDIRLIEIVDPRAESGVALAQHCAERGLEASCVANSSKLFPADLISFATSALQPWYDDEIEPEQIVLHISLRDIAPHRLINTRNIVDDIGHALKANTSLHLLEQKVGRSFPIENFQRLLSNQVRKPEGGVVAAFGMGILDVALADLLLGLAEAGTASSIRYIDDFLSNNQRW